MKHFSDDELRCKGSGKVLLADGFGEKLEELRIAFGWPMIVTSGCRSYAYNLQIGGHPNSAHVYDHPKRPFKGSYAVDIQCKDSAYRAALIKTALNLGWCVGADNIYLHLDRRIDYFPKYKQVLYLY